jgi:hypothetical protein
MTPSDEHIEFYDDEDDPNALPADLKTVWRWLNKRLEGLLAEIEADEPGNDEGYFEYLHELYDMVQDMITDIFDEAECCEEEGGVP